MAVSVDTGFAAGETEEEVFSAALWPKTQAARRQTIAVIFIPSPRSWLPHPDIAPVVRCGLPGSPMRREYRFYQREKSKPAVSLSRPENRLSKNARASWP